MKLKKKEDKNVHVLVLLRRGNKILMRDRWWEEIGRKRGGRGSNKGKGSGMEEGDDIQRVRFEQRYVAMGDVELGVATSKSQKPGEQKAPRIQQEIS